MLINARARILPSVGSIIYNMACVNGFTPNLPYNGIRDILKKEFFDKSEETFPIFLKYLKEEADEFNPVLKGDPLLHISPESVLVTYVKQCVYSFRHRNQEGLQVYKRFNEKEQYTLQDEESGEYKGEADFLVDDNPYTSSDIIKWRKKIPYLLHKLHEKGKLYGISTISGFRAIYIIQNYMNTTNKFKDLIDIQPSYIIAQNIYEMDKYTGECTNILESNTGKFQQYFHHWLRGVPGYKDSVYENFLELLRICRSLNIDVEGLDPKEYGQQYINSIFSSYLIDNRDLIQTVDDINTDYKNTAYSIKRILINEVRNHLRDTPISAYLLTNEIEKRETTIDDLVVYLKSLIASTKLVYTEDNSNLSCIQHIFGAIDYINSYYDKGYVMDKKTNKIKIFNISKFKPGTRTPNAILTSTGYFVILPCDLNQEGILYLAASTVLEWNRVYDFKDSITLNGFMKKNLKFGEWEEFRC